MPDAGVSRKRQIRDCRIREPLIGSRMTNGGCRSFSYMKSRAPVKHALRFSETPFRKTMHSSRLFARRR